MKFDFDIARITEAFAAAVLDSTRWNSAMELASAETGSLGALMFPNKGALPYIPVCESMAESFEVYIRDGWIERDERHRGLPTMLERGVVTDLDFTSREHKRHHPYFQDFITRCGLYDFAGVRVGNGENVWCLSIQRTAEQGDFSRSELRSLAQLARSLDSIAETASALAFARGEGALAAFDIAHKAAFLLDRRGEVVRVNQAAEALLGDDVFISHRRLSSRSQAATAELNAAIKNLLWLQSISSSPSMIFPRREGLPLLVHAIRCPGLSESALSSFHALVVIVDPEQRMLPTARTLQTGFDLTQAEARLAIALSSGSDLKTEAKRLCVSPETMRKHLRSIFSKTGVRRQSELTALLAALLSEQ